MDSKLYMTQIRTLKEQFQFDFVSIAQVVAGSHPFLTWTHAAGNKSRRFLRIVLESGKGIAGGVHKSGRAMVIQNVPKELTLEEQAAHPITIAEELISLIALPLWIEDSVQGVLLMSFREPDKITEELFRQVLKAVVPSFCGYSVHDCAYGSALHSGGKTGEPIPIYEMMDHHIIQAQEEERRRISRMLHDNVVQELLGIQVHLRSIKYLQDPEKVSAILEQTDGLLTQIQNELRTISSRLRPTSLDDLGLNAALRSHFRWVEENHGVLVHLTENIGETRYSMEVETAFYRVCQEAVLNACKYAGCDELEVSLCQAHDQLSLIVTDRGKGFDAVHPVYSCYGTGLSSMAERAELIDGDFAFTSSPGEGTTVTMTAPVKKEADA